ncbi:hypothetical protein PLANPX_3946 [Lacipirellula parvula]|uniref:Uncharacterized protein n=1 Tax=Lacipirellula parvula TaxID=2650471 RepID=A0A5K7XBY5_9BACT|nr:hypothetical protein PLANPX_3946 [Lacipirellula parvula]
MIVRVELMAIFLIGPRMGPVSVSQVERYKPALVRLFHACDRLQQWRAGGGDLGIFASEHSFVHEVTTGWASSTDDARWELVRPTGFPRSGQIADQWHSSDFVLSLAGNEATFAC